MKITNKTIKIEYDDDQLNIINKINELLFEHKLKIIDDDEFHDGYCLFKLEEIK